ncbi:hypothetical protein NLI96_g415 [Meripilus lineatus]|uniref:Uncharacterized protein n=1 Tax=Meripilus lineatus TaxID=2056292 RepID=A0AAD5YII2_9APHY|nr:hypothetical protein NLI96_g415 [Physisporinus lineatus]
MAPTNKHENEMVARVHRIIREGVNREGNKYIRYIDCDGHIGYAYYNRLEIGFWRFEAQDGEVTTSEDVAASDDKTATSGNVKGKLFQRRPGK